MLVYFENEKDAVGFAAEVNQTFGQGSASITIISPVKFAVSYAPSATDTSLDDTELLTASGFFKTQANT